MDALIIEGTTKSPSILFDPANLKFEISGESRPEHATKFYEPVLMWLKDFKQKLDSEKKEEGMNKDISFIFKLSYFNSISAKFILDILKMFEELSNSNTNVSVKWYYDKRDEDMKESGEEFAPLINLPFEFIGQ
jgi:hypothetical protein